MPAFLPSELPEVYRSRHHWITLFRLPHKILLIAFALLVAIAIGSGNAFWWFVLFVCAGGLLLLRIRTWYAETVILTRKRIIRVQGIPETTTSEASLRIDRVSGAVLVETVPGKLLGYGTIDLEAPGDHPDVRHLERISHAREFYLCLRALVFADDVPLDPDERPVGHTADTVTDPLPDVSGPPSSGTRRMP